MSMAERKTMTRAVKNPVKRKLTRAEKKEIAAVIQAAKGDGKPHTAQQTIPYLQMYPDGICRVTEKKYSKSLVFEDINYQLAQADDNGNCILLDDGDECVCPQLISYSLLCKWFRVAVLPADRLLYAELYQTGDKKKCTECGAFFASTSNSVKYCPVCRKRITRRQAAERMRKRRAPVTQ